MQDGAFPTGKLFILCHFVKQFFWGGPIVSGHLDTVAGPGTFSSDENGTSSFSTKSGNPTIRRQFGNIDFQYVRYLTGRRIRGCRVTYGCNDIEISEDERSQP